MIQKVEELCEADLRGISAGLGTRADLAEWLYSQGMFPLGAKTQVARIRRGRWTLIPSEWRGRTTYAQTIRDRPSKRPHKARRSHQRGIVISPEARLTRQEKLSDQDMLEQVEEVLATPMTEPTVEVA